jgi:hypothetical protein
MTEPEEWTLDRIGRMVQAVLDTCDRIEASCNRINASLNRIDATLDRIDALLDRAHVHLTGIIERQDAWLARLQ